MARAPSIHNDAVYNARARDPRPAEGTARRPVDTRIERCNAIDSFRPTAAATSANASVSVDILEVHDAIASGHAAVVAAAPRIRERRTAAHHQRAHRRENQHDGVDHEMYGGVAGSSFVVGESSTIVS